MTRLLAISRGILLSAGLLTAGLVLQHCGGVQPIGLEGSIQGYEYQIMIPAPPKEANPKQDLQNLEGKIAELVGYLGGCDPAAVRDVNLRAGDKSGSMEQAAYDIVLECFTHRKQSAGLVEFLAGPLNQLYGFCDAEFGQRNAEGVIQFPALEHLPTQAELDSTLALVQKGGTYVVERGMLLSMKGMAISLEQMLEGRVVSELNSSLHRMGYTDFKIRFGSTTGVWGEGPDGGDWLVNLQDPRDPAANLGKIRLHDSEILAQAGCGSRAMRLPDESLCYAINPLDGKPVAAPALAATVSRKAVLGDVCATALLIGQESYLDAMPGEIEGACWFAPDGDWSSPQFTGDMARRFEAGR